ASRAYDAEGQPTKAAEGFARGRGLAVFRIRSGRRNKLMTQSRRAGVMGQTVTEKSARSPKSASHRSDVAASGGGA
ncbi:MAG: hypothetical protein R6W76_23645, partial [Caldilinea sp.]